MKTTNQGTKGNPSRRRLVLVDLFWTRDKDPRIPLGHASIRAALEERSSVDIIPVVVPVNDVDRAGDADAGLRTSTSVVQEVFAQVERAANGTPPGTVDIAFGVYVWNEGIVQTLLRRIRATFGDAVRIILGGPQISYAAPGVLDSYPDADCAIRGYAEDVLTKLVESSERTELRGVAWAGEDDTGTVAECQLDDLPSPWLSGTIPIESQKFIRWETQRGCPYRCSFCQHREAGARFLKRELLDQRIVEEIALFCRNGVEEIAVLDPIFNANKPRAQRILDELVERGFLGELSLQCRAESVNEAFVKSAARLRATLEFGLQTVIPKESEVVNRRNNIKKVEQALHLVREHGVHHEVSIIFGLPTQTLATFRETVRWCLEQRVPIIRAFPLMLLRGTPLERDRHRWSLEEDGRRLPSVVASDSFSRDDHRQMRRLSLALRATENEHPTSLVELERIARATPLDDEGRFSPPD